MTKHTPGPWRMGSLESWDAVTGRPFRCVYRGDDESVDTRLYVRGGEGENGAVFDCDADARLIAAAPELLEALRETLEWITTSVPPGTDGLTSIVHEIGEVIAKAEGRA